MNKQEKEIWNKLKRQYADNTEVLDILCGGENAREKQIPKIPHTCGSYCPTCGTIVLGTSNPLKKYCEFCGQRLDLSQVHKQEKQITESINYRDGIMNKFMKKE